MQQRRTKTNEDQHHLFLTSLRTSRLSQSIRVGVGGYRALLAAVEPISELTHETRQPLTCDFTGIIKERFGAVLFNKSAYLKSLLAFANSKNRRRRAGHDPPPAPVFSNGRMKCQRSHRDI